MMPRRGKKKLPNEYRGRIPVFRRMESILDFLEILRKTDELKRCWMSQPHKRGGRLWAVEASEA